MVLHAAEDHAAASPRILFFEMLEMPGRGSICEKLIPFGPTFEGDAEPVRDVSM
jgi:hypothetical protein